MKSALFLRIASGLLLLQCVLHTIGGVLSAPEPGAQQTAVTAMKTITFPVMGLTRSFWDFHIGFGLGISISMLLEGVVLWQLSSMAKADAARLRPIMATFLIGYLLLGVNAYVFFFPPPVIAEVLIVLCLGMAIWTARPAVQPQ